MRRTTRCRVSSTLRTLSPGMDQLEVRQLLSTAPTAEGPFSYPAAGQVSAPLFQVARLVTYTNPPSGAFTPSQIEQAYGFNAISFGGVKGDGTGQTIAIVDAYSDASIQSDLNAFDRQFNLPSTTVTQVNEAGGSSLPGADSTGGWELEESLDVEWVHAIAPGAKILLVAATSPNDTDLLSAVGYAASHANVVSMSWGGGEFSGETTYDGDFSHAGVTFVASSGDNGAPIEWPAASPNILAVGGTALTLSGGSYGGETGWSGSGGGPSSSESQPSYQSGVVTQTNMRANPDVAYDASPSTGFAVYDSVPYNGTSYGWMQIGGTSAGAPQWSALVAIADQGRALANKAAIDATNPQDLQTSVYNSSVRSADFHDITGGTSTGSPSYSAGVGYDYVTGIGTPIANLVVQSLDGTVAPPASDTLSISAPASATAGTSFAVTVTARTSSGVIDPNYAGTINLTTTGSPTGLPSSYKFTTGAGGDDGSHTFTVTYTGAGAQTVKATDASTSSSATAGITVSPAAASQIVLSGLASTAVVGSTQSFTVTARDPYGNVATGFTGTVSFTSTDRAATLPASYTFTTANAGTHTFNLAFGTSGSESVTAAATGFSATQSGIAVSLAAPTGLTASAASSSQINLSWIGSAGANGYTIQVLSGTTWTQIGTTAAGVTTYAATGLTAGTTYSYRVIATSGAGSAYNSAASATASATTVNTAGDTIWSNSYVPNEDAYAGGSYEVGVKFESNVSGTVTGARFYQQTWMSNYAHIGHLWSSSGTLLATATFTSAPNVAGWQQVSFSSPVAISANIVYIVSFSTGGGYFGISTTGLSTSGVTNGPLTALSNSAAGGNGVYASGTGVFPTVSGGGMNFWADVVFSPTSSPARVPGTPGTPSGTSRPAGFLFIAPSGSGSSNVATQGGTSSDASVASSETVSSRNLAGTTVLMHTIPQGPSLASFRRKGGLASDPTGF